MQRLIAAVACVVASTSLVTAQQPAPAPAPAPAKEPTKEPAKEKDEDEKPAGKVEYFSIESKVLEQSLNIGVYLPPNYAKSTDRLPVLYFLHGLFGSARKWEERATNKTLDDLINDGKVGPMIVVCPDGKNSMYINWVNGKGNWGDFLATELVQTIDAKYRTLAQREARGVNGDSMGGYGALNLAFKHPDLFGSVSAHSAAIYPVDTTKLPDRVKGWAQQWAPQFGWPIDVPHWEEWNPLKQAATLPEDSLKKLKIYFDCGDQDRFGFGPTNEELHKILDERKVPHEWHMRSGGHGRDFFEENVHFAFLFHGAVFDAAPRTAKPAADGKK